MTDRKSKETVKARSAYSKEPVEAGPTYIEERRYFPTGCDPEHYEAESFSLKVTFRGGGKWSVDQGRHQQMTHTGRMTYCAPRMTLMRWCRFTFAEACEIAEQHVDEVKVNGRTWSEWQSVRGA